MKTSEQINEISKAMNELQKQIDHAKKDSKNPHLKNTYASLASCLDAAKEPLASNGLSVVQAPYRSEPSNQWILVTRVLHISGQWIEGECPIITQKTDAQGFGSGLTYARRYGLCAILGISQEDDDGNDAVKKPEPQFKKPQSVEKEIGHLDDERSKQLAQFVITSGKYLGKSLEQIPVDELKAWYQLIDVSTKRTGKPIEGEQAQILNNVREWIELCSKSQLRAK